VPDTASYNFVYHSSEISFWKYAKIEEKDREADIVIRRSSKSKNCQDG
jgi:hypothetical protein